jgi:hypothetical protein
MMEQNLCPEESKKREEGRQAPEPKKRDERNQEEPANHDGTEPLSGGKKEERRRETSTGTVAEPGGPSKS